MNQNFNRGRADVLSPQIPTEARIYDHIFMYLSESIVHCERNITRLETDPVHLEVDCQGDIDIFKEKIQLARDTEAFLKGILLRVGGAE